MEFKTFFFFFSTWISALNEAPLICFSAFLSVWKTENLELKLSCQSLTKKE